MIFLASTTYRIKTKDLLFNSTSPKKNSEENKFIGYAVVHKH